MLAFQLGPLALPVAPLVWLFSCALAILLAWRLAPPASARTAGDAFFLAALLGLAVARLGHVALHLDAYALSPLAVIDLRDGGLHAGAGVVAGALWLAWHGWRHAAQRQALTLGLLAGLAFWMTASLATRLPPDARMPELALTTLEGARPSTLSEAAAGRPAVVNLWASWCGPCRAEMPTLADAQQRDTGAAFLFVNQGESETTVRSYLERERLPLREVLLDARSALGPAVGSRGLPTTLFYDASGRLVEAHMGVLNAAALQARLDRLMPAPR